MDITGNRDKTEIHPNSLANLKPFEPGKSGNPSGRPKRRLLDEILAELLTDTADAEAIARALIEKAKSGDDKAAKLIAERTQGKPTQKLEHSGPDGEPIQTAISVTFVQP